MESPLKYLVVVKENQFQLLDDIKDFFRMLVADTVAEEIDCGRGCVERRTCVALGDLSLLDKPSDWKMLRSLLRIQAERFHNATGKTACETHSPSHGPTRSGPWTSLTSSWCVASSIWPRWWTGSAARLSLGD